MSKLLYDDISAQIEKTIKGMSIGDKLLSERMLSVKYGVSRNVLREALRSLSEKGLLEIKPGRGIYVANLENEKVVSRLETMLLKHQSSYRTSFIDIVEARTTLELAAFDLASERATEDDLTSIYRALSKMKQSQGDVEMFNRHDLQFHLRIAEATHNSVFPVLVNTLCEMTGKQMFMFIRLNPDKIGNVLLEHMEIVEAIKSKDKSRIAKAGLRHFNVSEIIGGVAAGK
ncbi:MAG: FadR/GntR family transcriptional regulator [Pseudomonadota bacterium]